MKKMFILNGVQINSNNRGINAICYGAIKIIIEKYPNADIYIFANPGIKSETVQINNKNFKINYFGGRYKKRIYYLFVSYLCKLIKNKYKNIFINKYEVLRIFKNSDYVIDLSAGDGFSDIYGLSLLFNYQIAVLIGSSFNVPILKFPQTIGPFNTFIGKLYAKYVLKKVNLIMLRESISSKLITKLGYGYKSIMVNDLAFLMPSVKEDNYNNLDNIFSDRNIKSTIGINISGLLANTIDNRKKFTTTYDYLELIEQIILTMAKRYLIKIVLIPHDYDYEHPQKRDDLIYSRIVYNKLSWNMPNLFILDGNFNAQQLKGFISKLDFFIGSRMHACIAAVSQNIPTVSISYSYKFKGVMSNLNIEELVIDPNMHKKSELIEKIWNIYDLRDKIKLELEEITPKIKTGISICKKYI